jgi:hypothetical protein
LYIYFYFPIIIFFQNMLGEWADAWFSTHGHPGMWRTEILNLCQTGDSPNISCHIGNIFFLFANSERVKRCVLFIIKGYLAKWNVQILSEELHKWRYFNKKVLFNNLIVLNTSKQHVKKLNYNWRISTNLT